MRLLNTTTRKLEEFGGNNIPLYAILSHKWGENEITFQDIEGAEVEKKVGYEKVRRTCAIAAAHGFGYVWIDTCCINKISSAELSEAINSMYRWYQGSMVCYAYLADVPPKALDPRNKIEGSEFLRSRWFTRGWTLQELIAPPMVIFLDQGWQEIGTKSSLHGTISTITGIPNNILLGGDLESASVAQRMSWASKRETKRVEDVAYCLMGIFGINMPLVYGEGEKAFIRLQEEIMKVSDDHSLFAWESLWSPGGLLATSPVAFSKSGEIIPVNPSSTLSGAITVNNKGVHLKLCITDREVIEDTRLAILPCTKQGKQVAISVRAISETGEYFMRSENSGLELLDPKEIIQSKYRERSICVRQKRPTLKNLSLLPEAAAHGNATVVKLLLEKGAELESKDGYGQTPLSRAAEQGHEVVVKLLLEQGADLESKDQIGRTPLSIATEHGHDAVIKLLLEKGVDLESKDQIGRTPLSIATEQGHDAVIKLLLDKGADLKSIDGLDGRMPLLWAAENGREAVVKQLLEQGADLESKDQIGRTALWWAAEKGHGVMVKLLLEKGADLESKDQIGRTALSWAAEKGHGVMVKLLLEQGAELESKDLDYGQTPLWRAAANGHEAVVKLLLEKGAELESKDNDYGRTPLWWAAEYGHEAVVKLLLEKGAELESKDKSGRTPLSWAAEKGHEAVVKLLLEKGAKLESKDNYGYGRTPLWLAAEYGHEAVVKLLLEKGAKLESKDNGYGNAPLWRAAKNGHEAVVKLLLEKGAELESKDSWGRMPLSLAAEFGYEAVVKLLLEKGAELESKDSWGRTALWWATASGHEAVVKLLTSIT